MRTEGLTSRPLLAALLAVSMAAVAPSAPAQPDGHAARRAEMVENQLRRRGIRQSELLDAMATVPRHLFSPEAEREVAYRDSPLPDEDGSVGMLQPYISALMIELLELDGSERVLEVGTGSGYDAAVLSSLASEVYTIEISERRGRRARQRLERLGYRNVHVKVGDGHEGWPEEAPFDAIILTAAPEEIPPALVRQLRTGGRMVAAVGGYFQELTVFVKTEQGLERTRVEPVRIGPMSDRPR